MHTFNFMDTRLVICMPQGAAEKLHRRGSCVGTSVLRTRQDRLGLPKCINLLIPRSLSSFEIFEDKVALTVQIALRVRQSLQLFCQLIPFFFSGGPPDLSFSFRLGFV